MAVLINAFMILVTSITVSGLEYTLTNKGGEYEGLDLSIGGQTSLDFSIKQCESALVCLSNQKGECTDNAYILEIGISGNTKVILRRCTAGTCSKLVTERVVVLKCNQFVLIQIRYGNSKLILTADGTEAANINVDSPVTVKYADFSNQQGTGIFRIDREVNECLIPDSGATTTCSGNRVQCINKGCCYNGGGSPQCYRKYEPSEETTTTTTLAPTTVETTSNIIETTTTMTDDQVTVTGVTSSNVTSDTNTVTSQTQEMTSPNNVITTMVPCSGDACNVTTVSMRTTTRRPRPPFLIINGCNRLYIAYHLVIFCAMMVIGQLYWRE